jgi:hypothetical protein
MSVSISPVDFAREIWPEEHSKTPEKHPNFAKFRRKKREETEKCVRNAKKNGSKGPKSAKIKDIPQKKRKKKIIIITHWR